MVTCPKVQKGALCLMCAAPGDDLARRWDRCVKGHCKHRFLVSP